MRSAHPAAAAARRGFDHDRVADFLCDFDRVVLGLNNSITSRRHRHTHFAGRCACCVFVAHRLHCAGRRPDKLDIATLAHLREMWILREESVAGMDCIDVANLGSAHDAIDFQITFRAWCCADADGFIRQLDMQ